MWLWGCCDPDSNKLTASQPAGYSGSPHDKSLEASRLGGPRCTPVLNDDSKKMWAQNSSTDAPHQIERCLSTDSDRQTITARLESELLGSADVIEVESNKNAALFRKYELTRQEVAQENDGDANEVIFTFSFQGLVIK
jgi:hypothetical protein